MYKCKELITKQNKTSQKMIVHTPLTLALKKEEIVETSICCNTA